MNNRVFLRIAIAYIEFLEWFIDLFPQNKFKSLRKRVFKLTIWKLNKKCQLRRK